MKEIKAVIQPVKLQKLRNALVALPGFPGMTVSRAEGCSPPVEQESGRIDIHAELTDFSPKVRIEILAPDDKVAEIVQLIRETCQTGHLGDGIIWVTPAEGFLRIRNGESG